MSSWTRRPDTQRNEAAESQRVKEPRPEARDKKRRDTKGKEMGWRTVRARARVSVSAHLSVRVEFRARVRVRAGTTVRVRVRVWVRVKG